MSHQQSLLQGSMDWRLNPSLLQKRSRDSLGFLCLVGTPFSQIITCIRVPRASNTPQPWQLPLVLGAGLLHRCRGYMENKSIPGIVVPSPGCWREGGRDCSRILSPPNPSDSSGVQSRAPWQEGLGQFTPSMELIPKDGNWLKT